MWITMTIVFAILLLVCISINSDRAKGDTSAQIYE